MQSIPFHIAYLLTKHECVTIPDFGAFVVSSVETTKVKRWDIFSSPENQLKFDSEIKYDNGLLANSVMKEKNISYEEASQLINKYAKGLSQRLEDGKTIQILWVGTLYLEDDKIVFQQERNLSCNVNNYGLTNFSLPLVADLQKQTDTKKRFRLFRS